VNKAGTGGQQEETEPPGKGGAASLADRVLDLESKLSKFDK
jgi:hypothetical protein